MRDDRERLRDIQEAIEDIERHAVKGRQAFDSDELIQTWIVHRLQIIGEAVAGLSNAFRQQHAGVPWTEVVGMRNILIHQYFGVDLDVVWDVVQRELPHLKSAIAGILGE